MKRRKPCLISLIIPVYNARLYLDHCIESISTQSFKDFEVIFVDDSSTDESLQILQGYAAKDSRVKVLTQENAGAGAARNRGVEAARGKYLAFADPDDILERNMLAECYRVAERENSDLVAFCHTKFDSVTGNEIDQNPFSKAIQERLATGRMTYSPEELADCFFTATGHAVWSKFFRRSLIEENGIRFQELRRTNDLYFADMALLKARRISFLDEPLYRYRKGIASTTTRDDLVGMCFVGYRAIKNELVASGKYSKFAKNFIAKVVDSLVYEIETVKDAAMQRIILPRLLDQFLDILPLNEIVRFCGELPSKLTRVLKGQQLASFHAFKSVSPLDDPKAFPDDYPVAVIIPVYNAFEPLCNLVDGLFKHSSPIHEIIFVNDASPDERILPFLKEVCACHHNARLVNNDRNYGFSHNVNLGASLTERDFVILNTDTEVPDRWLPRLFAPLRAFPESTGSVTPMSTDALELTLPYPGKGGIAFVEKFGLDKIDRAVASVIPAPEQDLAWRGLGFAMAISRKAWNKVGPFAEEVFGRGYHEESDWCFRARRAGFENRVAVNVVVPHMHNGSFAIAEKKKLLDANYPKLKERNPEAFTSETCKRYRDIASGIRAAGLQALTEYGVGYSDCEWSEANVLRQQSAELGLMLQKDHVKKFVNERELAANVVRQIEGFRIDCVFSTADVGSFEIASSEYVLIKKAAWVKDGDLSILCIIGNGIHGLAKFISKGGGKMSLMLRGRDFRSKDGKNKVPFYVDYTSVKVRGKEMLKGRTSVWHDKPHTFTIEVKAGEEIKIEVETAPHVYERAVLKDKLLKAKLPFAVEAKNVDEILDSPALKPFVHDEYAAAKFARVLQNVRLDVRFAASEVVDLAPVDCGSGVTVTSPAWIKRPGMDGRCVYCSRPSGRVAFKCQGAGKVMVEVHGQDVRMKDDGMVCVPFKVDCKSVRVRGKEMLKKRTTVWNRHPFAFAFEVKAGEEIKIEVETAPHVYERAVLKDMLLKAKLPFAVEAKSVDAMLDDPAMRMFMPDVRDAKIAELQKQLKAAQEKMEGERKRGVAKEKAAARKQKEVEELHRSQAYRTGMFVTWPARKAWGGVKCLRENGVGYTVKHLVGKVARAVGVKK